jgi:hypothetical protein
MPRVGLEPTTSICDRPCVSTVTSATGGSEWVSLRWPVTSHPGKNLDTRLIAEGGGAFQSRFGWYGEET